MTDTLLLTFPYIDLNWKAISNLWRLLRFDNTFIIAFSSVPKPFIAFLKISASCRASNGFAGLTVGFSCSWYCKSNKKAKLNIRLFLFYKSSLNSLGRPLEQHSLQLDSNFVWNMKMKMNMLVYLDMTALIDSYTMEFGQDNH